MAAITGVTGETSIPIKTLNTSKIPGLQVRPVSLEPLNTSKIIMQVSLRLVSIETVNASKLILIQLEMS